MLPTASPSDWDCKSDPESEKNRPGGARFPCILPSRSVGVGVGILISSPYMHSVTGDLWNSKRQLFFLCFHCLNLQMVRNLIIAHVFEGKGPSSSWYSCLSAPLWF